MTDVLGNGKLSAVSSDTDAENKFQTCDVGDNHLPVKATKSRLRNYAEDTARFKITGNN